MTTYYHVLQVVPDVLFVLLFFISTHSDACVVITFLHRYGSEMRMRVYRHAQTRLPVDFDTLCYEA